MMLNIDEHLVDFRSPEKPDAMTHGLFVERIMIRGFRDSHACVICFPVIILLYYKDPVKWRLLTDLNEDSELSTTEDHTMSSGLLEINRHVGRVHNDADYLAQRVELTFGEIDLLSLNEFNDLETENTVPLVSSIYSRTFGFGGRLVYLLITGERTHFLTERWWDERPDSLHACGAVRYHIRTVGSDLSCSVGLGCSIVDPHRCVHSRFMERRASSFCRISPFTTSLCCKECVYRVLCARDTYFPDCDDGEEYFKEMGDE